MANWKQTMSGQAGQQDSDNGRTDNESYLMPDMEEWRPELEKLEPEQLLEVALEALSDKSHDEIEKLISSVTGDTGNEPMPENSEMVPEQGAGAGAGAVK